MKKKKKKWTDVHPRGYFNKSRILNLLKKDWTKGVKQNEIIEKSKLTKPTVSRILEELLSEHKIFKLNNLYFPEFDDDFTFGYFFSDYINHFLTKILEKKETISNLTATPYKSPKLIDKEDLPDKSIFEFANAIGGLITYTLIESSNLYAADGREPAKIKELVNNIFKGVIWENIFYQFENLFGDILGTKNDKKGFDKISKSLMNVYPRLYETLETNRIKFFKEWIKDNARDNNLYANCDHEWKEHYMFKCGKFEECIHCRYQRLKQ